ncbi:MAG: hypothetical protein DCC71_23130 [Proteobacteria bacterium]|nr:MAG: hypothetical protein DCC71_23130 [Pseudomonadota bacterium]
MRHVADRKSPTVHAVIEKNVSPRAKIHVPTGAILTSAQRASTEPRTVNGQPRPRAVGKRGNSHDTMKSVRLLLDRSFIGAYHKVCKKHLYRYLDEVELPPQQAEEPVPVPRSSAEAGASGAGEVQGAHLAAPAFADEVEAAPRSGSHIAIGGKSSASIPGPRYLSLAIATETVAKSMSTESIKTKKRFAPTAIGRETSPAFMGIRDGANPCVLLLWESCPVTPNRAVYEVPCFSSSVTSTV